MVGVRSGWLVLAMAALGAAGCGGSSDGSAHATSEYLAAVRSSDGTVTGTFRTGAAPAAGSGPAVTASSNGFSIVGGSSLVELASASPFTRAVLVVEGANGFYEVTGLPSSGSQSLSMTLAQRPPGTAFNVRVAVGSGASDLGAYQTVPVTLTTVGTGDVQVSITWDQETDVDLHVLGPDGVEIYYGNQGPTASGGQLDLDSNGACSIDHKKNENITWPTGRAPAGTYRVLVDYWEACGGDAETKYVVTVNVTGRAPQTFSGTLTGGGDNGGACYPSGATTPLACGTEIATFTK